MQATDMTVNESYVAMLISNSTYPQSALNARESTIQLGEALGEIGFQVYPFFDLTAVQLVVEANRMAARLAQLVEDRAARNGTGKIVFFFYYAGHGGIIKEQEYITGVDYAHAGLTNAAWLIKQMTTDRVRTETGAHPNIAIDLKIFCLDTCNVVGARHRPRTRGAALRYARHLNHSYVLHAEVPGQHVTFDCDEGAPTPFVQALCEALRSPEAPGNELLQMLSTVISNLRFLIEAHRGRAPPLRPADGCAFEEADTQCLRVWPNTRQYFCFVPALPMDEQGIDPYFAIAIGATTATTTEIMLPEYVVNKQVQLRYIDSIGTLTPTLLPHDRLHTCTNTIMPVHQLNPHTVYAFQARIKLDGNNLWSSWSGTVHVLTARGGVPPEQTTQPTQPTEVEVHQPTGEGTTYQIEYPEHLTGLWVLRDTPKHVVHRLWNHHGARIPITQQEIMGRPICRTCGFPPIFNVRPIRP
eukprot:TRINITY_DN5564_c0_g4_i1.p1 TRINITY_DN5564_c0_g4~~TRINITY_DN5564_c0_g4_i1.p1  ORF type:complete len:470 (+),score=22.43 TRINITY_DN5564_c0_g4_i1:96-1505(+)